MCESKNLNATILAQFYLSGGPSEAAQQHWDFPEAMVRPGSAELGQSAAGLSQAD